MLHHIDTQGNFFYHCREPECKYHNCANWDAGIQCAYHPTERVAGESLTAHISHPLVQWTQDGRGVMLPPCPIEGHSMTQVLIHTDEELLAPVITRDEQGAIVRVDPNPSPKFNGNLWFVDSDIEQLRVVHPALAHLSFAELEQMHARLLVQAPLLDQQWMLVDASRVVIHSVTQHPAVARHRELARQLLAAGISPPTEVG